VLRPAAAILLLATAGEVRAQAEPEGGLAADLWAESGAGVDSNPRRLAGAAGAEGFATALARGRLRWEREGGRLSLALAEAGRLYPGARGADALASRLEAAGSVPLPWGLALAGSAVASDLTERDGLSDRHALRGEAALGWAGRSLGGSLAAGWSLFSPREASLRAFRSRGPEGWLRAWWRPSRGHRLAVAAGATWAIYPGWAALAAAEPTRDDTAFTGTAEWSWTGPALVAAGWAYTRNASGARGGDFERHRATLRTAVHLGEESTLALRAALQWTRYPDSLFAGAQQRLAEGQEGLDLVEARLARHLGGPWELAGTATFTRAEGGPGAPAYSRLVGVLSLGWRTPGP
jgi:hypothetical protein